MTEFSEVYSRYFADVYRYCLSLCRDEGMAEELTQETFFKALQSIDTFQGRSSVYVWLCQIAKHTYFNHCKREKHLNRDADLDALEAPDSLEERLLGKESAFAIHQCLHRMEEPYKEIFSLRTFGELSFAQIAKLFGKTESWARVTYHRARLKIKEELQ
ncbi:MAG: RNA polymerase sigma factor [Eubacteriales bacterium]|nr:RNA polymerase sigma factor [Eubacteriales bacterium]